MISNLLVHLTNVLHSFNNSGVSNESTSYGVTCFNGVNTNLRSARSCADKCAAGFIIACVLALLFPWFVFPLFSPPICPQSWHFLLKINWSAFWTAFEQIQTLATANGTSLVVCSISSCCRWNKMQLEHSMLLVAFSRFPCFSISSWSTCSKRQAFQAVAFCARPLWQQRESMAVTAKVWPTRVYKCQNRVWKKLHQDVWTCQFYIYYFDRHRNSYMIGWPAVRTRAYFWHFSKLRHSPRLETPKQVSWRLLFSLVLIFKQRSSKDIQFNWHFNRVI